MAKRTFTQEASTLQLDAPRTLTEVTYERLRDDIIEGRLEPGEKLRIEHLKKNYDVAAATLREAITRLKSDALVISEGQRGFWVAPISVEDLEDLTQLRLKIEIDALKQSISNNYGWWREQLQEAYDEMTASEQAGSISSHRKQWESLNSNFHKALVAGAESKWTEYILALLSRQSERYRRLSISMDGQQRNVHQEHEMIFNAAMNGESLRAALALEMHIRTTPDLIIRALKKAT